MPQNLKSVNPTPRRGEPAPMLTLAQAADYAGVHTKTIRRRIADGHLPASRMAGSRLIRIRPEDLDELFRAVPTVVA